MKHATNKVIVRPIIYGSIATFFGKEAQQTTATHSWSVYVRGIDGESLDYLISKVEFHIHSSFERPIQTITASPYIISELGWGEFTVKIRVFLRESSEDEEPVVLFHYLKLFPDNGQAVKNRSVVSEVYDELVFINPWEKREALVMNAVPVYKKEDSAKTLDKLPEFANKEQVLVTNIAREDEKIVGKIFALKEELAKKGIVV